MIHIPGLALRVVWDSLMGFTLGYYVLNFIHWFWPLVFGWWITNTFLRLVSFVSLMHSRRSLVSSHHSACGDLLLLSDAVKFIWALKTDLKRFSIVDEARLIGNLGCDFDWNHIETIIISWFTAWGHGRRVSIRHQTTTVRVQVRKRR